ncbi:MAG: NAD(P)-dependent oxidoreductase [Candidatus Limnocylindrales bacterium]
MSWLSTMSILTRPACSRSTAQSARATPRHGPGRESTAVAGRSRDCGARRRALVTGGARFVGSHLVDRLLIEGIEVLVVDDPSTSAFANVPAAARIEPIDVSSRGSRAAVPCMAAARLPSRRADGLPVLGRGYLRGDGTRRLNRSHPAATSYYGIHSLAAEGHVALAGPPDAIAGPPNIYGPPGPGYQGRGRGGLAGSGRDLRPAEDPWDGTQAREFVHVEDVVDALWAWACRAGRPASGACGQGSERRSSSWPASSSAR